MADLIEVKDLHKKYGNRPVLNGLHFNVKKGECFCLLGPNGAGKTTTLKILTGLLAADHGQINIFGEDAVKYPEKLKGRISIIPQYANLDPLLTVNENLIFFGLLQKIKYSNLRSRIDELLNIFEIESIRGQVTFHCSGGEYQRLLVARAFLKPSDVIFMDEPTSGMDILFKNKIWEFFRMEKTKGLTIFLNTHDLTEAEVISDRIAFLFNGQIIVVDRPEMLKKMIPGTIMEIELKHKICQVEGHGCFCPEAAVILIEDRNVVRVMAPSITKDIIAFLSALSTNNEILSINIQQPSLNDVFRKLGVKNVGNSMA